MIKQTKNFKAEREHCYAEMTQLEKDLQQLQEQNHIAEQTLEARAQQIGHLLQEKGVIREKVGFKMRKFDLYGGQGDPVAHLRRFCSKMRGAGGKEELLIACFSLSLSVTALERYTRQDHSRWYTWDDLAQAFTCHFQYNLEIIPDHLSLTKIEKKPSESFREYDFHWREQAARVDPPMKESEMVDYFLQALETTYYGHLVLAIDKSFNKVVKMGGMVEKGLKSNKILSYSAIKATTQAIQNGTGGVIGKKKKEDVATIDSGACCEYCSGTSGHDTEKCWHLKNAIQELIDTNRIEVQTPKAPNINQNPLPTHQETNIIEIVHKVGEPKKPSQTVMMIRSSEVKLDEKPTIERSVNKLSGTNGEPSAVVKKGSPSDVAAKQEKPKVVVPGVANKPVVIVEGARTDPVVIKPVTQLPIVNSKAVPWNYERVTVTYKGKEVKEAHGLTRSGRCFALEELRKAKSFKDNPLRKTPAQILLFSLLIYSDEHRHALMKILNESHVPDKISMIHLEKIANKIFEVNRVTFSDDELHVEGTKHNRALYLMVKCEDSVVTRVLVDNGSSANICPLSTLNKLKVDDERIHKNNISVRGFDGGGKDSVGDIVLELTIGPVEFTMEFQEIIVHGEDNLCAHSDAVVPFIEVEDDKGPWVYQVFEIVSVEKIPEGKCVPIPKVTAASVMMAFEMPKNSFVPGKGMGASLQGIIQPMSLPKNLGTFGLGFKPTTVDVKRSRKLKQRAWALPKPIPRHFRLFVKPGARKRPVTTVPSSVVGVDEELIERFERLFDNVNMVEVGAGSNKQMYSLLGRVQSLTIGRLLLSLPDRSSGSLL
ncbi:uncharacterized protein [Nicotiana sylvestris]|uniref:uncharacterized protein n=1 Tax=Nicotiana sylvestris TaxID=4096 RepID=UPI00388CB02B